MQESTSLGSNVERTYKILCLGCGWIKRVSFEEIPIGWFTVNKPMEGMNQEPEVAGFCCSPGCAGKYYLKKAGIWTRIPRSSRRTNAQIVAVDAHTDEILESGFRYLRAISASYRGRTITHDMYLVFLHEVLTVMTTAQSSLVSGSRWPGYISKWDNYVKDAIEAGIEVT